MSEATPRPWRTDGAMLSGLKHCRLIVGGDDGEFPTIFIESLCDDAADVAQFAANVALIVRAVNAHDALVGACEAAAKMRDGCECERCAPCLARAALALARPSAKETP